MDPITLSATVVAALTPYFSKFVSAAGDKLATAAGEAASKGVTHLYEALKHRATGTPVEASLHDLERSPEDPDNQADLRKALRKLLAEDPGFAEQLRGLLPAEGSGGDAVFHNTIQGNVGYLNQGHSVTFNNGRG
jgi:hypothetical protein